MVDHKEHRCGCLAAQRGLRRSLGSASPGLPVCHVKMFSLLMPVWGPEAEVFPLLLLWAFSGEGSKGQDSALSLDVILASVGLAETMHSGGSCLAGMLRRLGPLQLFLCLLL